MKKLTVMIMLLMVTCVYGVIPYPLNNIMLRFSFSPTKDTASVLIKACGTSFALNRKKQHTRTMQLKPCLKLYRTVAIYYFQKNNRIPQIDGRLVFARATHLSVNNSALSMYVSAKHYPMDIIKNQSTAAPLKVSVNYQGTFYLARVTSLDIKLGRLSVL